jgi:hypothetical protein
MHPIAFLLLSFVLQFYAQPNVGQTFVTDVTVVFPGNVNSGTLMANGDVTLYIQSTPKIAQNYQLNICSLSGLPEVCFFLCTIIVFLAYLLSPVLITTMRLNPVKSFV